MFRLQILFVTIILLAILCDAKFLRSRRFVDEINWDAHINLCGPKLGEFVQSACNICADSPKYERTRDDDKLNILKACCEFTCTFRDVRMEIFAGLYVTLVFIVVCMLMAICYNWRRFVQDFDEVYLEPDVEAVEEEETPLNDDGPRLHRTDKEIIQLLKDNMLA